MIAKLWLEDNRWQNQPLFSKEHCHSFRETTRPDLRRISSSQQKTDNNDQVFLLLQHHSTFSHFLYYWWILEIKNDVWFNRTCGNSCCVFFDVVAVVANDFSDFLYSRRAACCSVRVDRCKRSFRRVLLKENVNPNNNLPLDKWKKSNNLYNLSTLTQRPTS